tara:strand:- start:8072 stop:8803 length:732 start_codon:yes stop_codon:yes gene_type:complete
MGASHSNNNQDTLDWEKINTDSFSSNLPSLQTMNKDTKELIEKLDLQENINFEETESENSNIFAWLNEKDNKNLENISDLINSATNGSQLPNEKNEVDSGTSPFISSEDYENLANEKTSESDINQHFANQQGGAINDTSSTSIGSVTKLSRRETIDSDDSNLSYLSSSAHTEGLENVVNESSEVQSEQINDYESSSEMDMINSEENDSQSEIEESTISPINNKVISSEINTTDINMLSSDKSL